MLHQKSLAATALAVAMAALLACLIATAPRLPERVASHFNGAGAADGWMSRTVYLWTMGGTATGVALLMLAVGWGTRYLPTSVVNLPHRDYWLAAERREATYAAFACFGLWMAALQALLVLGVHLLVVQANELQPPKLSPTVWWLLGGFLAATLVLIASLFRRFGKPPK